MLKKDNIFEEKSKNIKQKDLEIVPERSIESEFTFKASVLEQEFGKSSFPVRENFFKTGLMPKIVEKETPKKIGGTIRSVSPGSTEFTMDLEKKKNLDKINEKFMFSKSAENFKDSQENLKLLKKKYSNPEKKNNTNSPEKSGKKKKIFII